MNDVGNPRRLPIPPRAGDRINLKAKESIYTTDGKLAGLLDHSARLFQTGNNGSANLYNWTHKVLSITVDVWVQIEPHVDELQLVEHDKNRVFTLDLLLHRNKGQRYQTSAGERIGWSASPVTERGWGIWEVRYGIKPEQYYHLVAEASGLEREAEHSPPAPQRPEHRHCPKCGMSHFIVGEVRACICGFGVVHRRSGGRGR